MITYKISDFILKNRLEELTMKKRTQNIFSILLVFALMLCTFPVNKAGAASTLTGGYTSKTEAYNWGSYVANRSITMRMPEDENEEWFKFTLSADSKIYIRCSYQSKMEGCTLALYPATGSRPLQIADSLWDVYGADTLIPFMALNCDNTTSQTQTYYIRFMRGDATGQLYYTFTMYERIKRGHGTFNLKGTATNSGNPGGNTAGHDSSILSINLTNESSIPPEAIVYHISSAGTMSPSQGNVHHKLKPASEGRWFTALAANASNGSFGISPSDDIPVKQQWQFCYNVLSPASSTMKNVTLIIDWQYDLADTNYELYK